MALNDRTKLVRLRPKVLRRFYEPLLLLNALDQIRGARIKPDLASSITGLNHQKIRHSFADGIAYICAYKKEPDYVTAAALEKTPQGISVWLAANANIEPKVIHFLEGILVDLRRVAEQEDANGRHQTGRKIRESLTVRVVAFNQPRIQAYYIMAKNYVRQCLVVIRQACESTRKLAIFARP
jgi:hypothetical protein